MIRRIRIEWIVLILGVLFAFGAMLPNYYMATDDLYATSVMYRLDLIASGFVDQLYEVVFRAEGLGHFRPVQDFVYVIAHQLFGVDRWVYAVMIVYLLCHVASSWLLFAILRRLESPWSLAFVAALLFALHPVLDDNIASVQFGNNIPGLTCVLGACLLWLPLESASSRRSAWRLVAAGFVFFLAIGLGINLMVSGALVMGLIACAVAWKRRSFRELFVRGFVLAAAMGLAVVHRLLAYGTIGTTMPVYHNINLSYDPVPFLSELVDAAFLLKISPSAVYTVEVLNPPGMTWDDESRPLLSWDSALVLGAALLLVVYIVLASKRRAGAQRPGALGGRILPALGFGLILTIGMLLPYYLFLGRSGLHRYLYPSIAGIAVTVTMVGGGIGRVVGRILPNRLAAILGSAALLMIVGSLLKVDREAARSIGAGHRVARSIVSTVAADVAADPGIKRFYVLGYPRVIGRAGYSISVQGHLRGTINAKVRGHFAVDDQGYFEDLAAGRLTTPLDPHTVLYVVDPDGVTVRRIPRGAEGALPPHVAMEEYSTLKWAWNLADDSQVGSRLASPDPRVVEKVICILEDLEGGKRNFLLVDALKHAEYAGPGQDAPAPLYAALSAPELTANLLKRVVASEPKELLELALAAIECYGDAPVIVDAVLDVARRTDRASGRVIAANVAVRAAAGHDAERQALLIVANDNPKFDSSKASSALDLERKARALARDARTAEDAERTFTAAQSAWGEIGVPRDALFHHIAFCRVAHLDDADLQATLKDWTRRKWWWNADYLRGYLGSRNQESVPGIVFRGVTAKPFSVAIPGGTIEIQAVIENRSALNVPGGLSPVSGRLTWSWTDKDGHELAAGEQWLSQDGLIARQACRRPLTVRVPPVSGKIELRVKFLAFGKTCAVADPLSFTIVGHPATAESAPASR